MAYDKELEHDIRSHRHVETVHDCKQAMGLARRVFRVIAPLVLLALPSACSGPKGVCFGVGADGRDRCYADATSGSCADERRTWAAYLPGDKGERHWETSGVRTCQARGYKSCGPGGCSR